MATRRQRLAQRRKAVGLSQEGLAERLGVERSTVVRWEAGDTEPQPWLRPKLAGALQVSIEQLDELLADADQAALWDAEAAARKQAGEALGRLRREAGLTQQNLANRIGYARAHLAGAETGANRTASEFWERCDLVLAAGGALVVVGARIKAAQEARARAAVLRDEAAREARLQQWRAEHGLSLPGAGAAVVSGTMFAPGGGRLGEQEVSSVPTRREMLGYFGTGLLAVTVEQASSGGVVGFGEDASTVIDVVRSITGEYRRLECDTPSRVLLIPVSGHLQFARQFLSDDDSVDSRKLAAALSEASGFAAWLSFDMNDHSAARQHYFSAVNYARRAHSNLLTAYMLGSMSYWTLSLGNTAEALDLIQEAKKLEVGSSTGQAWLATIEASAQAATRDADAAMSAIRRAEGLQAEHPAWPWLNRFDETKIAGYRGACHLYLDQPSEAQRALVQALGSAEGGNVKQRALLLVDLATAYWKQDQLEPCCHYAGEAFEIAIQKRSAKILHRVRHLRRALHSRKDAKPVRDLDERLLAGLL